MPSLVTSHPARPASTAPVVSTYSPTSPRRSENPVIQSIAWFGPATKPSSDIVKCQSTFPAAVCRSVSHIGASSTSGSDRPCCRVTSGRALVPPPLVVQHSHHDEVFPAVRVQLGFTADALPAESAGQVAVDGTAVGGQHLQLDAVRAEHVERSGQYQPGHLAAESSAAQGGSEQAHRVGCAVLIGIDAKSCAADALAVVFDRPGVGAGIRRAAVGGQVFPAVIATAVPLPAPR